ncbi:hypothetical protein BKA57DRAFT_184948 [Linnemannia elongata]|nr:hypothetical protein BKA57DRAFT_184948 [Linnemannia elongata]
MSKSGEIFYRRNRVFFALLFFASHSAFVAGWSNPQTPQGMTDQTRLLLYITLRVLVAHSAARITGIYVFFKEETVTFLVGSFCPWCGGEEKCNHGNLATNN